MAVCLAQLGFGLWSLVWGHLAGVAAWTGLLWIAVPWRPNWRIPMRLFRPMLAYGRHIVAVNFLAAILHHVDLLIVGRMLGAAALGFYQMACEACDGRCLDEPAGSFEPPLSNRHHAQSSDQSHRHPEGERDLGIYVGMTGQRGEEAGGDADERGPANRGRIV